jgi:hypothetical protein
MKFDQTATLIGVVGKKGNGTLDNGQDWATDRVELHVITPFPDSDVSAFGSTVTCYQVADHDKNLGRAKACLGQEIVLSMEMVPAKKLGQAPKFICLDFSVVRTPVTGAPSSVSKSAS